MTRKLHRLTGAFLLLFLVSHLTAHLFAIGGPQAHNNALKAVQWIYRNPVVEPLLVVALLAQIMLGIRLAVRRWKDPDKGFWGKAQIASGIYLGFFILIHTSAALLTRNIGGLETNFYWISGTLLHPITKWAFYPYYALTVIAAAAHIGSIIHFRFGRRRLAKASLAAGFIVAAIYLLTFGGWLYPVNLDPDYSAYYDNLLSMSG